MIVNFNWQKLRESHEGYLLALDILMLWLLTINLVWYFLDVLFGVALVRNALDQVMPSYSAIYARDIHPNFVLYDLGFLAVFLAEFFFRWGLAIKQRTYHRWFFFPFVHWYDVLGCIPLGGFRLLRLLRVFSIIYRLHKLGIIDFRQSALLRVGEKYYRILVEEVSDRVVINVLEGVQSEIDTGGDVSRRLVDAILRPRRDVIVPWLASRLGQGLRQSLEPRRDEIGRYVRNTVHKGLNDSEELQNVSQIPMVGSYLEARLEKAISEIVHNIVMQIAADLDGIEDDHYLQQLSGMLFDALLEPHEAMGLAMRDTLLDSLEMIKQQVAVQQWKRSDAGPVAQQAAGSQG